MFSCTCNVMSMQYEALHLSVSKASVTCTEREIRVEKCLDICQQRIKFVLTLTKVNRNIIL